MQRLESGLQIHDLENHGRQTHHSGHRQNPFEKRRDCVLKGFKSKARKPFEAKLKLEDGEVKFVFED